MGCFADDGAPTAFGRLAVRIAIGVAYKVDDGCFNMPFAVVCGESRQSDLSILYCGALECLQIVCC
eukprot:1788391-Lingulodinium_polyedra.AAC.1